jgi:hypothetical protein
MKKLFAALLVSVFVLGCRQDAELQRPEDYYNMIPVDGTTRLSTVFEGFWHGMNNNYVFWDVDPTDWDAVYDTYKPKFEALGTLGDLDGKGVALMRGYFQDMLKDIVDGHYGVRAKTLSDAEGTLVVRPAEIRYKNKFTDDVAFLRSEYSAEGSINKDNSSQSLLNKPFIDAVKNSITGDFKLFIRLIPQDSDYNPFNVATGYRTESGKDILYFHFSGFSWDTLFREFFELFPEGGSDPKWAAIDNALQGTAKTVREVCDYSNIDSIDSGRLVPKDDSDLKDLIDKLEAGSGPSNWIDVISARAGIEHFDYFFKQLKSRKNAATGNDVCGAIIDIRGNGGGAISDLSTLWGRIVPRDWAFAKKKFKAGENRLDYTPLVDFVIFKHPSNDYGGVTDIPLVLLVNKGSVSCSEMTTLFFKSLPNGHVVGGTTWGGMGELSSIYPNSINAGQFSVANGIIDLVYTPGLQVLTLDGTSYEGKGVPPDYPVPFNYNNMTAGTDDRLQKALDVVLEKQ